MPGSTIGLSRLCTIKAIDFNAGTVKLIINDAKSDTATLMPSALIPSSWTGADGEFAGGGPTEGATVWATQGQGGNWTIIGYSPSDLVFGNKNTSSKSGFRKNIMRALKSGRHLIQVKNNIRHIVDPDIGIQFGNPEQYVHIDPVLGISSTVFDTSMQFTEGNRKIVGPVLRDIQADCTRNISGSALTSHSYNSGLSEIGLDPRTRPGDSFTRNPAYNEDRELIYEFKNSFGFTDDLHELGIYDLETVPQDDAFFARDKSRADVLGLSLANPNHLIETIKGTVVDLYGNIVDLNRNILPVGSIDSLSLRSNEENPSQTFKALRRESRKSIAYHFEINARKHESPDLKAMDTFVDDNSDYSRTRSRFFVDIDKEGQFKINVPASSETGNIGLPVRYENYSVVSAQQNDTNPREFVRNVDAKDIYLDSFAKGVISLSGESDGELAGFGAPVDRVTGETIKLGTVFHDISQTLSLHNVPDPYNPIPLYPASKINLVPKVREIFSPEIIVQGESANAGGRSGTFTLDGHLSVSIGANTVDRQSLWWDCAGGVISNIGRDIRGISYAGRFDGDVLMQIGGSTPNLDSRFIDLNNEYKDGVLDIRVATSGQMHIIRIDASGVRIYTPGELDIVSEGHMRLGSRKGNLYLNAENIYAYADQSGNARWIARNRKSID